MWVSLRKRMPRLEDRAGHREAGEGEQSARHYGTVDSEAAAGDVHQTARGDGRQAGDAEPEHGEAQAHG